jgi:hypothetical protein
MTGILTNRRNVMGILGSVIILAALALGAVAPPTALAQEALPEPFRQTAGPYEIGILAAPSTLSIGEVTFVVTVADAATGQPVPDAHVVIRVEHDLACREGCWGLGVHTTDVTREYQAVMNLDHAGEWRVAVEVTSPLGEATVEAPPVQIAQPLRSTSGSLVFVGMTVVIVLGAIYVTWTIRRAQRRRGAANAG